MPKNFEKVLTGFNHNIKHRGKVYHVQTEDSGVSNPHIITHLFVGGNIVASKRTSYADIIGAAHLAEIVRELMEEQHKEMLRNLIGGAFDDAEAGAVPKHYQPGQVAEVRTPIPTGSTPARAEAPLSPPRAVPKAQPKKEGRAETLFGEDLISEKSLDEVILSYLAGEGDQ
ncbi:MAG TPA: hypothetical protein VKB87_18005 [Myxococcaceae bacterium]|nr:hypothetical protein [Myxococcaceae bacterium]